MVLKVSVEVFWFIYRRISYNSDKSVTSETFFLNNETISFLESIQFHQVILVI